MATSTELLRAAEHMRKRANDIAAAHATAFARDATAFEIRKMADELEREATRLEASERRSSPTFCHCHPGRPMRGCPNPRCQG